jgi:hypothetical protein
MNDPKFIRNSSPHEVSMPEGSRVAASKSAEIAGPAVRQLLAENESAVLPEIVSPSSNDSLLPGPANVLKEVILAQRESHVDEPRSSPDVSQAVQATFKQELEAEPEMNFPARLIYLKLENDKVKSELDSLELQMTTGV